MIRRDMLLWVGCIAGALQETDYVEAHESRFREHQRRTNANLRVEDARTFLADKGMDMDAIVPQVEGKFMAAFVRAMKPKALAK